MKEHLMDELLIKCLEGRANDQENERAFNWIYSDNSHFEYYKTLRDAWILSGINTNQNKYDYEEAWKLVAGEIGVKNPDLLRTVFFTRWKLIAAALVIAFLTTSLTYYIVNTISEKKLSGICEIQAPLGSRTFLILPDKSTIWLNAGSKIIYANSFSINDRLISLSGEAFFEVNPTDPHPFIVATPGLEVQALGTSFNIKAYPEEDIEEITLITGHVKVEATNVLDREEVHLNPNQKATLYKDMTITTVLQKKSLYVEKDINPELYISWKGNNLVFEKIKLSDLAVTIERMYNIEIVFDDEGLKNSKLTGTLKLETIEHLLNAIKLTVPFDYSIEDGVVHLYFNNKFKEKYFKLTKKDI